MLNMGDTTQINQVAADQQLLNVKVARPLQHQFYEPSISIKDVI